MDAARKGASAILCQKEKKLPIDLLKDVAIIEVKDTLEALQLISQYYRKLFAIPFIAVTGSTGKTTTKDIISSVLAYKYNVLKSMGNLNNQIGLPLTLLNLEKQHEMGVVEMGMSSFGEIEALSKIVNPHIAVITNIGLSHIEHLGSRENIMKAKMEIASYLNDRNYLLLNGDDDQLCKRRREEGNYTKIFFGLSKQNDFYPEIVEDLGEKGSIFSIRINGCLYEFSLRQPGIHNVYNALAAVWIGLYYKLSPEEINLALKLYSPTKMRLEIIQTDDVKIINDAYNASPDSMKAALSVLSSIKGNRRIAVLGNMLEMGDFSEIGHRSIGDAVVSNRIDILITVGEMAKWIGKETEKKSKKSMKIFALNSNQEAIAIINNIIEKDDIFLIKGSRGMRMEEIVKFLQERS